jgi:hypothetical protein
MPWEWSFEKQIETEIKKRIKPLALHKLSIKWYVYLRFKHTTEGGTAEKQLMLQLTNYISIAGWNYVGLHTIEKLRNK